MTNNEQKEYDEAMKELECIENQKHLKNCPKCQEEWQKALNNPDRQ